MNDNHALRSVRVTAQRLAITALLLPGFALAEADAQMPKRIKPVVVSATRTADDALNVPAAIDVIDAGEIRRAQPAIQLSETLSRVPGVVARDRQNFAQDLQISIRGFGARASFGVRGVRLYSDGIPATMPDGQGQVGHFDLANAQRVEVLRGPFSALYGNGSGGARDHAGTAAQKRSDKANHECGVQTSEGRKACNKRKGNGFGNEGEGYGKAR